MRSLPPEGAVSGCGRPCATDMGAIRALSDLLINQIAAPTQPSLQPRGEILRDMSARIGALQAVADDVYARWARALRH